MSANCSRTVLEPKELLNHFSISWSAPRSFLSNELLQLSRSSTPRLRDLRAEMVHAKDAPTLKSNFDT